MAEQVIRTQVGIVGAGPAGLVLAHLLDRAGIDSVVLEARSRQYIEQRVRAGVLEHGTAAFLEEIGVGERMRREGLVHHGIELRFDGTGHRIPFDRLTGGRGIVIYGQQELVKDLVRARLATGRPLLFEVEGVTLEGLDSERPCIRFRHQGRAHELRCDFIAGCDGFHGVSRSSVPPGTLTVYERRYPFAWLGILAEVAPSSEELVYAYHDRGFALHSMRSPALSRLYVQCDPRDRLEDWPDARVWEELQVRLEREGWSLQEGPVVEKSIAEVRSFVAEPMQYGRLFLAGDAVHIVPPTGAKGLNLAVRDVRVLGAALAAYYADRDPGPLAAYSRDCLRHVWRAQHFAAWMTEMLHRFPDGDGQRAKLQRAQLQYVCFSQAAAASLAENYVGFEWGPAEALGPSPFRPREAAPGR